MSPYLFVGLQAGMSKEHVSSDSKSEPRGTRNSRKVQVCSDLSIPDSEHGAAINGIHVVSQVEHLLLLEVPEKLKPIGVKT